jgi:excisionase family DNA binding protein
MNKEATSKHDHAKLLVTVEEAAYMMSLGRTKVFEMVLRKEIPSIKVGRSRRIPVSGLIHFVQCEEPNKN